LLAAASSQLLGHHGEFNTGHVQLFEALLRAKTDQQLYALRPQVIEYIYQIVTHTSVILTQHDLDTARDVEDHNSLVESLLDLTNYEDNALLSKAFEMLHRIVNTNSEIFRLAEEAIILVEPSSIELVNYLDMHMSDFRDLGAGIIDSTDMKYDLIDVQTFAMNMLRLMVFS
jgi:hypothetical protein